jgi:hypothetical protein
MLPSIYGVNPFFISPFSHSSEYLEFERRSLPLMRSEELRNLETDMEDAGQDPAVGWPVGVLEWVWSHPGAYKEVQRCARICVRDERLHGML